MNEGYDPFGMGRLHVQIREQKAQIKKLKARITKLGDTEQMLRLEIKNLKRQLQEVTT